jgi:hypothetical protein
MPRSSVRLAGVSARSQRGAPNGQKGSTLRSPCQSPDAAVGHGKSWRYASRAVRIAALPSRSGPRPLRDADRCTLPVSLTGAGAEAPSLAALE